MNLDEDVELDRILAGTDFTEGGEANDEPGLSLELELVGVVVTPTVDAVGVLPTFLSWTILQGLAIHHLQWNKTPITGYV